MTEAEISPLQRGEEIIRSALAALPESPGVYRMCDASGKPLYIGKARQLKKRVVYYTRVHALPDRLRRMVSLTASVEFTQTRSEAEALMLEGQLVKTLQPRYNILLKDDKSFPYLWLTGDHDFPRALKYRGAKTGKGRYFGPFASGGAVNEALTLIKKAFLLRSCSDSVFAQRTRPCLEYQIKRCTAPCVGVVDKEAYAAQVRQAADFLSGKNREVQEGLASAMEEASARMDYEAAALYRDRIRALSQIHSQQALLPPGVEDADIASIHREGAVSAVVMHFIRGGQSYGMRAYFPAHAEEAEPGEVLESFLAQFYQNHAPPGLVIVSHALPQQELVAEGLSLSAERRVAVEYPQRGGKRALAEEASRQAAQAAQKRLSEAASLQALHGQLQEALSLSSPPRRIEVYDNSHIMGTDAIGAMIVASPEGFIKPAYRSFTIKGPLAPGDDFAMMREMLSRRFARLQKEDPERKTEAWPDLLLIDGGKGQLGAALAALEGQGITGLPVCAIAKGPDRNAGREEFHLPGRAPFGLPPGNALLHYLQRLRDEAHRFAIGTHRAKRGKARLASPLDDISGIGAGRKRELLRHFGSARAVAEAGLEELKKVKGISGKVAETIYNHFRER